MLQNSPDAVVIGVDHRTPSGRAVDRLAEAGPVPGGRQGLLA
jgi:hypothetical protein